MAFDLFSPAGGVSPSSSAGSSAQGGRAGPATVTVGAFNPPALSQVNQVQALAVAAVAVLGLLLWRRR